MDLQQPARNLAVSERATVTTRQPLAEGRPGRDSTPRATGDTVKWGSVLGRLRLVLVMVAEGIKTCHVWEPFSQIKKRELGTDDLPDQICQLAKGMNFLIQLLCS